MVLKMSRMRWRMPFLLVVLREKIFLRKGPKSRDLLYRVLVSSSAFSISDYGSRMGNE